MAIQVFEINDCEWWAGEGTPADILAAYMLETGVSHEDATGDADQYPRPLTNAEMDCLMYFDDEIRDLGTARTFRQQLAQMVKAGEKFPCFFATTEF